MPVLDALAYTASQVSAHVQWATDIVSSINGVWPTIPTTGFQSSMLMVLLGFPWVLAMVLWMVWCLAAVGPARKTFSTALIVLFGVPAYLALSVLLLLIFWIVAGFASLALAFVGPLALAFFAYSTLYEAACELAERQQSIRARAEDITFGELFFGLLFGILSFFLFGAPTLLLTFVKAPVVLMSGVLHFSKETLPKLFEVGCWCPIAFLAWCFVLVCAVCVLLLSILVSAVVKVAATAIWPAYVVSGWLRYFGARRQTRDCCTPLVHGLKAGYQVLFAADLLTNAFICMRWELLHQTLIELQSIIMGDQEELSAECRTIACLPPVVVGIFQGDWGVVEGLLAQEMGISKEMVREAWRSLKQEMVRVGRQEMRRGLLTQDYISEIPPQLIIGLPARVLLETVERSPPGELVLASGLKVREERRPKAGFADKVWQDLQEAQAQRAAVRLTESARLRLCAALLAGGGDMADLPRGLAEGVREFEEAAAEEKFASQKVLRPLIGVAVQCSRERAFKDQLEDVLRELLATDAEFSDEEEEALHASGSSSSDSGSEAPLDALLHVPRLASHL